MSKKPNKQAIDTWIQLHRTYKHLLDSVENSLKQEGLPPLSWYDVLLELNREKSTGLRQYEIGNKILLNKYNLSRLIDRLEKNRLLVRYECDEDGRGNVVKITEQGQKLLKKIWPVYSQSIQENFSRKLVPADINELLKLLKKVSE